MSEVAGSSMSVANEIQAQGGSHGQSLARFFAFAPQRRKAGLMQITGGAAAIGMGAFLLGQIGSTHAIAVQLAIIGSVGVIGGIGLLVRAVGDLLGRLVIDDVGIAIRPSLAGYSIKWDELDRWKVDLKSERYPDASSVLFWTSDEPCAMFSPNNRLSHQDRIQIRRTLQSYAGDRECDPSSKASK